MTPASNIRLSAGQPLPVRMRADLVIAPYLARRGRWWTVKDPLALRYFQLRDEELFVLRRLDGRTPASSILREFQQHFAPCRLVIEELLAFVQRLAAQGLVTTDVAPTASDRVGRQRRRVWRQWWSRLANPLAMQWRGFDPQALLDWLYPSVRWLFAPLTLGAGLAVIAAAIILIVGHWDQFRTQLPTASAVLAPGNLIWIATAIAVVKVLHELGHALTCRHLGGECHELGLMLLAFVPCLYCNVSDAWLFPGKWRRIAVSAAGICVELVLAAVCTFLWWYSEPGPFHELCLSIMIVASVGTLLLNGNPLLRYDGYYVLSDLLEVPNLRQRSAAAWRRYFARCVFGIVEPDDDPFLRWRPALALYGVASSVYSWMVVFLILRFVDRALEPHGLRPLAVVLATLVVGGRLAGAAMLAVRRVGIWSEAGLLRPARFGIGCAVLAAAVAAAFLVPLPHRVSAPFVVVPRDAHNLFVSVPGELPAAASVPRVQYGDRVAAGQVVAVLESHVIAQEIVRLEGERARQAIVVEGLRRQQLTSPEAAARLSSTRSVMTDLEHQLEQRRRDRAALTLTSPVYGELLPPLDETPSAVDPLRQERPPLDPRNHQPWLSTGTVVGVVADPGRVDALLVVDQVDLPYIRAGQRVRLRLGQSAGRIITGEVVEVATRVLEHTPAALVATGRLPSRVGADGTIRPLRTAYEVRVELVETPHTLAINAAGTARIETGRMDLAHRLARWVQRTFTDRR
jgi:putative peptide zinc metalloprotease protein